MLLKMGSTFGNTASNFDMSSGLTCRMATSRIMLSPFVSATERRLSAFICGQFLLRLRGVLLQHLFELDDRVRDRGPPGIVPDMDDDLHDFLLGEAEGLRAE